MPANAPNAKQSFPRFVPASLHALFDRRWLVAYFVQRQLTSSYRGSFLGFLWAFLGPLLMIALYTLVFSEIIGLRFREVTGDSTLNFGLYVYCGLLPFLAYSESLNQSVSIVRNNAGLVQKVVFPLEALPLSATIASVVDKLFGVAVLVLVVAALEGRLYWTVLLIPGIMAFQLVFSLGLNYLFAVVGAYLPDTRETLRSVVRASFFVTPIIWDPAIVADRQYLSLIVDLNPVAYLVGAYRDLILNGELPGTLATLYFALFAAALFAGGFALFTRTKKRFADLV